jgi:hypothetical protein
MPPARRIGTALGNSDVASGVHYSPAIYLGSAMVRCRSCGDPVDPRRVELGYDYCTRGECQLRCVEHVELASIGINKAADYYVRADDVLPPPRPERGLPLVVDDEPALPSRPARANAADKKRTPATTLERLRRVETELEAALDRCYERFAAGELTAKELDRERDRLTRTFNSRVMAENIRYRSLLRKTGRV